MRQKRIHSPKLAVKRIKKRPVSDKAVPILKEPIPQPEQPPVFNHDEFEELFEMLDREESCVAFENSKLDLVITDSIVRSPFFDTSIFVTYSFIVVNQSETDLNLIIEESPDRVHTFEDFTQTIKPFETQIVVPKRFAKYTRLAFVNPSPDVEAHVKVFFQAQTYRCTNPGE
ncbi:DUF6385 domain-containing protein [Paenibacillus elgii]|uniref:DUF6385 domain-containing protein n=1 Tax=Paenibacillus elgii TaxID=189691 RepID=A0A163T3S0_9BACL|nr:DUF6385 domain-containing protein [Paenibacillus elgii]KZE70973.1 hypothetical protein AV654_34855 [Paenibacillus elgii]NEN84464.1 hypothetical protein [Paenibacillus elgii]